MLKAQELRNNAKNSLEELLQEERAKLLELRMKRAGTTLKNVKEIRARRKNIARILTVLKSKSS